MPAENDYDLFITDQERKVILEERSIDFHSAERTIVGYPWTTCRQCHAQLWKQNTKYSFSIHYLHALNEFEVGFSDKSSRLKLPLPHVGAIYGLFDTIDKVVESLRLFYEGEFEKLEHFIAKHRRAQKGD